MDHELLLAIMLEYLNEGVLVVDPGADIVFFNEPTANIAGVEMKDAVGKNILEIFPGLTPDTSTFYHVLRTGKPLIEHIQSYTNFHGQQVTTVTSTIPILKDGVLMGAMEIYRGVDQVKKLSDKIRALQNELNCLFRKQNDLRKNGTIFTADHIIGNSTVMRTLKEKIYKVADSNAPVLVIGETGTGKEMVVQSIHNASLTRREKPFVAQNCAAIPEALLESIVFGTAAGSFTGSREMPGLLEQAHGGTLFLDEINSMDLTLQAKLLRVLQDGVIRRVGGSETKQVDVRIIAACNIDPKKAVEQGILRADLYYRLNSLQIKVEPLRSRKEDLPELIQHFLKGCAPQFVSLKETISEEALEILMQYDWPGNVRELKSVLESAVHFSDGKKITSNDLPQYILDRGSGPDRTEQIIEKSCMSDDLYMDRLIKQMAQWNQSSQVEPSSLKAKVDWVEKELILNELRQTKGNISQAARNLKLPVQTLYSKVQKHGISLEVVVSGN